MKLNTGKQEFKLEFDNGNVEYIYFNPNDPNLALRLSNLADKVKSRVEGMDIELGMDGKPTNGKFIDAFATTQEALCNELDEAFGGEISAKVFKYCSPFAIVGGEYFIVQFMNGIAPEIKNRIEDASGEVKKKMEKHIGKYRK